MNSEVAEDRTRDLLPPSRSAFEQAVDAGTIRVTYVGDAVITAGSLVRFEAIVEADFAIPEGAEVGLARRWPSDWGLPQFVDPGRIDFVGVSAAPGRQLRWWSARLHAWHPFDHVLLISLPEGLQAREPLRVSFGGRADRRGDGSGEREAGPGYTAQTFIEEDSPLAVRLRPGPDEVWTELARPTVRIVGNVACHLVLTAPSRVEAGKPFLLHVRAEDQWGNPARMDRHVRIDALPGRELRLPDCGWMHVEMALATAGVHRIVGVVDPGAAVASGHAGASLNATSNPIEVVDGPVGDLLCWGDIHGQSVIGCGARSIDAYFRHARDFAATDFGSHQANCFLVSGPEWADTERSTSQIHEDGRFVSLLGVEWSAQSAYGGDHNLYFPGDSAELHRCSHEFVTDKSDAATDLPHIDDLHRHYRGSDAIVAVHVGGRTADLRWHDPSLDRLIEVHSTHATSEWFLLDALKRGYRMGVISGSDGVDGRPGASHPGHMNVRNVRGGLTAVTMPALSRTAMWTALKSRHCYGTTGPRIILRLSAGGAQMGDEISVEKMPPFDVAIEGTAPLETIDFFRDDAVISSVDLMSAAGELSNAIRIGWCGTTARGNWQRARMRWDGELRVRGARVVDAKEWALDTPDEGLRGFTAAHAHADENNARESGSTENGGLEGGDRVAWRSITAGDWDGLVLTLDDPSRAELTFVTEPMTLHARVGDLGSSPRTFSADNPSRTVELRRLPLESPPLGWRGRFEDPAPPQGAHAYWVRVRQSDGAYAWSTPIFTTLAAAQ